MSWTEYKWIAKDENGDWFAYKIKPERKATLWGGELLGKYVKSLRCKFIDINWKQSLRLTTEADREWIERS